MAAEPMETKPTIVCLLERAIEKASKRKWRRPHLHQLAQNLTRF
jgi:hypothetical protein